MLYCSLVCALGFAILGSVAVRIRTGSWHGATPAALFAVLGGVLGLGASFSQRTRMDRQEVELRADDFSVRGIQQHSMRYEELRGYSIVEPTIEATTHRLLILYPRSRRAFSIGIAPEIADDQIHAMLAESVPFVTIIDDEALKCP